MWLVVVSLYVQGIDRLRNLRVLCVGQNNIRKIDDVKRLEACALLEELVLVGNNQYLILDT